MMTSELARHAAWRRAGPIAVGGTVLGIVPGVSGATWLATAAGMWHGEPGRWQLPGPGVPMRATALAEADGLVIASGDPSGILYSADGGSTWSTAWVDETTCGVTCFAVSPRFPHDRVLLAGTDGAGILRSNDGGRYWHLANVGLSDFTVLALAVAPLWTAREIAFAATEDAVYRSPNGGRAWKRADRGLEGIHVQTFAISPAFAADACIFAGSEQHGIYHSADGGDSWQPLPASAAFGAINGLWLIERDAVPVLIAGTGDGMLVRSTDRGESWSVVADGWPVLALEGNGDCIYAGVDEAGLLSSDDGGLSWKVDTSLAARDITRLATSAGGPLLAFGPTGGVWVADGAQRWRPCAGLADVGILIALLCSDEAGWFAASDAGLLRSNDAGATWQISLELADCRVSAVAAGVSRPAEVWAGAADGTLWRSCDAGREWRCHAIVAGGKPLVSLAVAKASGGDHTLIAASFDPAQRSITLWRSSDAGASWERWLADDSASSRSAICIGDGIDDIQVSVGSRVWQWDGARWQPTTVDATPLTALIRIPGTPALVAATIQGVYVAEDGQTWEAVAGAPAGLTDMALVSGETGGPAIVALAPGGVLWQWPLGR